MIYWIILFYGLGFLYTFASSVEYLTKDGTRKKDIVLISAFISGLIWPIIFLMFLSGILYYVINKLKGGDANGKKS